MLELSTNAPLHFASVPLSSPERYKVIFRILLSDIFALRKCRKAIYLLYRRDIFDFIKCDISDDAICCLSATRCDTNPRLRSKHIVCKTHIASQREISQIPQGIYIAKQKICYPFGQQILLFYKELVLDSCLTCYVRM